MKFVIFAVAMFGSLISSVASAAGDKFHSVDLSLRSYHINDRCYDHCTKAFNEDNIGIGITYYPHKNAGVGFGVFKNSFNKTSLYNAYILTGTAFQNRHVIIRPGLAMGIASGYAEIDGMEISGASENGIVPIISPNVSFYMDRLHINVAAMPSANTVIGFLRIGLRF